MQPLEHGQLCDLAACSVANVATVAKIQRFQQRKRHQVPNSIATDMPAPRKYEPTQRGQCSDALQTAITHSGAGHIELAQSCQASKLLNAAAHNIAAAWQAQLSQRRKRWQVAKTSITDLTPAHNIQVLQRSQARKVSQP
jgi:hypothetical protein